MKRLAAVAGLVFIGCPGPGPGPRPTPTPPVPPRPMFTELLLRQDAGVLTRGGQPFTLVGAIPCWPPDDSAGKPPDTFMAEGRPIRYWWPLVSPDWIDYAMGKGANAFHIRLGPAVAAEQCCGNQEVGGPYVGDTVDGGWNEAYWKRVREIVTYACTKGAVLEVDLIDGWLCRHSVWEETHMPWPRPDVEACTGQMTPVQRQWIRKAVEETGWAGCVIYQVSNESGVNGNWTMDWEQGVYQEVRKAEQEVGLGQVHMVGTNAPPRDVGAGPFDYVSYHATIAPTGPSYGRWNQVNEYNPALSPEAFRVLYCQARNAGQAFWYWRSDGSEAAMVESLSYLSRDCQDVDTSSCPFDVPSPDKVQLFCHPHGEFEGIPRWDCTPKAYGQPIRPEGDPFRQECEKKSLGGEWLEWGLQDVQGTLVISALGNPMQFRLQGQGSATLRCTNHTGDHCGNQMVSQ